MLTYTLEPGGKTPLYEQLYTAVKTDISQGVLKHGEKLPSKRKLAEHLGVSVVTVETAYAQLAAEGYVRSAEKRGYFVAQVEERPAATPGTADIPAEQPEPPCFMDLRSNHVGAADFPFSVWARLMRGEILERDKQLLQPPPHNGVPELRQAIADYLYHARGMRVHPEQILIGAGTEYLYTLIIQLLGRNKLYAVEDPGYRKIASIYEANDAPFVPVPIDRQGLNLKVLQAAPVDVVHLSPSHHFPTGIVMPITRRLELLHWASWLPGRYIIEDDYDSEFRFVGKPIPTLFSIDEREAVLYINTFSKTIAPSIRISYLILPPHLLERYQRKLGFYACTVPSFEQYTLARFIASGAFERHIARMKKHYRLLRDEVIAAIKTSPLSARCTIYEENAGLHFLVRLDTALEDKTLKERAMARGLRVACLSDYARWPNKAYDHILVINYTGIDPGRLPEALDRLAQVLDEGA